MVTILMMPAKMAKLGLLKIKLFLNEVYFFMTSFFLSMTSPTKVYHVTQVIL